MSRPILLVTGGCGFIGSAFVELVLRERPDYTVVNVDALTYAGNLANLRGIVEPYGDRYQFERLDITDGPGLRALVERIGVPDLIVNFAAESHVDRSIDGPAAFLRTNIDGTFQLLELARATGVRRFVQVSTDEVYGSLGPTGAFTETTPIAPSSPYSSTKASADLLVQAYQRTYGMDTLITRCSNNYGPRQFPEKLIPLMIIHALQGKPLPVYGDGSNVRDWIHVEDHCRGVLVAAERGVAGEVYNFGGEAERSNLTIVQHIADRVAGHRDGITFVTDRPGHDWRYAMDITKVRATLDWAPRVAFEQGLDATIDWFLEHRTWWEQVQRKEHLDFYGRWYADRALGA